MYQKTKNELYVLNYLFYFILKLEKLRSKLKYK